MRQKLALLAVTAGFLLAFGFVGLVTSGTLDRLLTRPAPEVERARERLGAGKAAEAAKALEEYLGTGACKDGNIGIPGRVNARPFASFDLGLALFKVAEAFGKPFGQEPPPKPEGAADSAEDPGKLARSQEAECALRLLKSIAADRTVAPELRARAHYLAGNLEFLRADYAKAVESYEQALRLLPGLPEGPTVDPLGRDAAWNRAVALLRQERDKPPEQQDKKDDKDKDDKEKDKEKKDDKEKDKKDEQDKDDKEKDKEKKDDKEKDKKDEQGKDKDGKDQGDKDRQAKKDGSQQGDKEERPDGTSGPGRSRPSRGDDGDERVLDALERAPSLPMGGRGPQGGTDDMEDK